MNYIYSRVSSEKKFFCNTDPVQLTEKYGTPLYVYYENILSNRFRDLKGHISCSNYNNRLRTVEVLIGDNGNSRIMRKRDTLEDLVRNFILQ